MPMTTPTASCCARCRSTSLGYTTYDDSGDDWSTDSRTTMPSAGFTASDSVWD